jgi:hypothetical protein
VFASVLLSCCGGPEPLRLIGEGDAGKLLVDQAVSSINDRVGCDLLENAKGRIRVRDDGDTLFFVDEAPTQKSPLNFVLFELKTPTHARKMAVLYRQIGSEFGLKTTPNSVMQADYSWEEPDAVADSLSAMLREIEAGCLAR